MYREKNIAALQKNAAGLNQGISTNYIAIHIGPAGGL